MAEPDTLQVDIAPPAIIPDTNTDAPPQPIEIDLDSGDVIDTPEAPDTAQTQAPPAEPQKRVPRTQARIQTLTHERDTERADRLRLQQELEEARREAAENRTAKEAAERAGMENYGARVKADMQSAKTELAGAIAQNDANAVVEAQAKLAKAAAAEADFDAWTVSNPKQPERQQEQPRQAQPQPRQQQAPQEQPLADDVLDFVQTNTWFMPYQIGDDGRPVRNQQGQFVENPDHDPEMRDAAMLRDAQIKREIRLGRKPQNYLQTPEYYQDIINTVSQAFPDAFEEPAPPPPPPQRARAPQMQPARSSVAPVQRQAMPGQQPQKPGNKVQLSGEERSFVDSLVDNGTMRYPRDYAVAEKRGQKMEKKDAYIKYARERAADQSSRGNGQ